MLLSLSEVGGDEVKAFFRAHILSVDFSFIIPVIYHKVNLLALDLFIMILAFKD